jgi:lysozyme
MDRTALLYALRHNEGLRLRAYRDTVGKLTIGYGHNLDAKPLSWLVTGASIPIRVAEAILEQDVDDTLHSLDAYLPWWSTLDEVRQGVLAEMAFNMGVDANPADGLDSFVNTLKAIEEGRWLSARDGMLSSKWARQVGDRAVVLASRMLTGVA